MPAMSETRYKPKGWTKYFVDGEVELEIEEKDPRVKIEYDEVSSLRACPETRGQKSSKSRATTEKSLWNIASIWKISNRQDIDTSSLFTTSSRRNISSSRLAKMT